MTYILKTILTKFKRKLAAKSVKERLWYIEKILVGDIIVLISKIWKESE